jgi:hypothetical protein
MERYTSIYQSKKGGPLQHEEGPPQPSTALDSFFIEKGSCFVFCFVFGFACRV